MTYTTIGVAKAILAIRRQLVHEGIEIRLDNMKALFACNLPPDVPSSLIDDAIFAAGNLMIAERIRREGSGR